MKKLLTYLKPYWWIAILSPILMVGEVIVDLWQPKLMSVIVDQGVLGGSMEIVLKTGISMLLYAVLGGLAGIGAAGFAGAASQSFGTDLRNDAFEKVMNLSLEQTDQFTTGSLVTRLTNDINIVQDLVAMALRMFVRSPMLFVGGIVMMLNLNLKFAVVLLCVFPILLVVIWIFMTKASPLFTVVQEKLDKVNMVVQENISGARVVKAYVREEEEEKRFDHANEDLMRTMLRVQKLMSILNPILMLVMNGSVLAIIFVGGMQVDAKAMQVGEVMAAVSYVTQILFGIMMVSMMLQTISRAMASAHRITELLQTQPAVVSKLECGESNSAAGTVTFKNVSFHYPSFSGKPVLSEIDLQVNCGETVAVLGATGSGKSSLVNLIARFYDVSEGSITVDRINVKDYDLKKLRDKIGFVLQKSQLFSGTIADNIRWGKQDATQEEVIAAAKIAQADDFIVGFEQGYQTVIGEKGSSLSGGQKQRISIARAILKQPEILIFDDSTSALDLGTEARLQKALKENLKGTTIILIAQRVASVVGADRIAVLDNGSLAACAPHEELMKSCPIYQDIYNSQMKRGVSVDA